MKYEKVHYARTDKRSYNRRACVFLYLRHATVRDNAHLNDSAGAVKAKILQQVKDLQFPGCFLVCEINKFVYGLTV